MTYVPPGKDANGYPLDADGNWLECIPWTGQEAQLPLGYTIVIPGMTLSQLIYRVEVLDAEEEAGYKVVKKSEVKPGDIVIGVELNENSIKKVVDTYGGDWIRIKDANAGKDYNRMTWRDKFGSDGMELCAIKDLRSKQKGQAPPMDVSSSAVMPKPPAQEPYKIP